MPLTYLKLNQYDVSASAGVASIEFTNISQSFDDLVCLFSVRTTGGDFPSGYFELNSSTTSFTTRNLWGSAAAALSDTTARWLGYLNGNSQTASTFSSIQMYLPSYASGNNKSISVETVSETNGNTAYMNMASHLWSSSSAITAIKITSTSNFAQFSTATLYGIKRT